MGRIDPVSGQACAGVRLIRRRFERQDPGGVLLLVHERGVVGRGRRSVLVVEVFVVHKQPEAPLLLREREPLLVEE